MVTGDSKVFCRANSHHFPVTVRLFACGLRLVKAPQKLQGFHFLMVWHPRLNTDPRHVCEGTDSRR
jgi:hypothetical protein